MSLLLIITTGVLVFALTNIDDIFILFMFFSEKNYSSKQVVFGQYLGISLLILISTAGALVALVIPPEWIGLLGAFPLTIGIKHLWDARRPVEKLEVATTSPQVSNRQMISVAAVTFSNGGDNIGVYTPLFASSTYEEISLLIAVFLVMTGLWCGIGYYLVNSVLKEKIQSIGKGVLPFVLIGLGLSILSQSLPLLGL